ncbi:MAG: Rrf2 family transcriptional regulator [Nitrospinaceae bacterium]|jgi:Rrf2 family transcriptional regulator, iron-sulfur cluster assembly transcription factor|nr:Rrf2 family transcriptional regulator [Nitrospinaceae bacterium]MBT3432787.1 Rrf2 family transcriptional regulator [Nitrospinaceae bacterium]MBT3820408.1 Rrf2 family transcriptional regulator [Nitrospinaceae bacterium]MBT4093005.1 Rrf2 family transcriptional regulator [Nitrospinaceae bacterium]MBT4431131.1 Rrf2 family transcriptional regulator [Nitrospinaceae bacterium]
MLYSRPCEYALRALTHISLNLDMELIRAQEIAEAENLPAPFLAKLLQQLARSGVLVSVKGPKGGFGLARPPQEISLMEVVSAVDGEEGFKRCAVGLAECTDETPCPLHDTWKPLRLQILDYMSGRSLADLAEAMDAKKKTISNSTP